MKGWLVQSAVYDDRALSHYRDGSLIDSRTFRFTTGIDRIVLGGELDGSPQLDMSVGAVVVYDRALSVSERQQVEAYLTGKYLVAGP